MELFPASDLSQWELIKTVINESDYYVVIVAGRYGSIHPETGLSFTEMEYDYAASRGVPIIGFLRKDVGKIVVKFTDSDPAAKIKLEIFRNKVTSKICRFFDEPTELGMLVMKSLMNEVRTNPRTGWVKADQARNKEDLDREQTLITTLKSKERSIKRLERKLRDISVPLKGINIEDLSQGNDNAGLSAIYTDPNKRVTSIRLDITWDEAFAVIAPSMYGYILRRGPPAYNKLIGQYSFEYGLIEYIRSKIIDLCGNRQISILPHQIDSMLIQFKQLGLVDITEKTEEDDGENFRGYSLTLAGEEHLTLLKVSTRLKLSTH